MSRLLRASLSALLIVQIAGGLALAEAPPTVWHALGIPQGWARMRDASLNKRGNRPNRERKPPLKALADPANLKSDVPAIKAAAEIKAQQDLAPQKIKAIKYLAAIGCGCYGGVAEALQAALEDCVEEVRFAAAEALESAMGDHCEFCQRTCCTPELAEKMYERAYGRDADGCYLEPSERVRMVLARVVALCPPDMSKEIIGDGPPPIIDTTPPTLPPPPIPDRPPGTGRFDFEPGVPGLLQYDALPGDSSSRRGQEPTPARPQDTQADFQRFTPPVATMPVGVCGEVVDTRSARGFIRLMFYDGYKPPVGTEVEVYHDYVLGTELAGTLVIRDWEGNHAIAAPRAWENVRIVRGDHVECVMHVPASAAPEMPPVPEVQTAAKQQPTPAAAPAPEAKPAARPAAPATNVATTTKPTTPAKTFVRAQPTQPAAPAKTVAATPAPVEESPSLAESSLNAVQRVFSLSTSKASSPTPAASRPAMAASSKAVPNSRTAGTKAVPASTTSGPAPIVKPTDAKRPTPVTRPTTAAAQSKSPSPVLAEMLRLPSASEQQQHSPMGAIGHDPLPAPIVRPQARVMPASANLPADEPLIERLPPIVSPSEARR